MILFRIHRRRSNTPLPLRGILAVFLACVSAVGILHAETLNILSGEPLPDAGSFWIDPSGAGGAKIAPVDGQPFDKAIEVEIAKKPLSHWMAQSTVPVPVPVANFQELELSFSARSVGTSAGEVTAAINGATKDGMALHYTFQPGGDWKRYEFQFPSKASNPGDGRIMFWLGHREQKTQISDIVLRSRASGYVFPGGDVPGSFFFFGAEHGSCLPLEIEGLEDVKTGFQVSHEGFSKEGDEALGFRVEPEIELSKGDTLVGELWMRSGKPGRPATVEVVYDAGVGGDDRRREVGFAFEEAGKWIHFARSIEVQQDASSGDWAVVFAIGEDPQLCHLAAMKVGVIKPDQQRIPNLGGTGTNN